MADEDDEFDDAPADDEEDVTMPCPRCGAAVYDDAVYCPHCDAYLTDEERATVNQPAWIAITALVVLATMLWAYLR